MTGQLRSHRPTVAAVVRAALHVHETGDSPTLALFIRRRLIGMDKRERLRFETTLAVATALFASALPVETRESLLALIEADDETLALTAALQIASGALAAAGEQS